MPRQYISKVKAPTGGIFYIKDEEAREQIAQIGNFTEYIGVTEHTPNTSEVTVKYSEWDPVQEQNINKYILYCLNPDGQEHAGTEQDPYQKLLVNGDVVSALDTTATPQGQKEYIFNGSGWTELGSISGLLGTFAYVDVGYVDIPTYSLNGTIAVSSTTLNATSIPVTINSSNNGGGKIVTNVSTKSITYAYSVSKATFSGTSATIEVSGTATQTSAIVNIPNATTTKYKVSVPKDKWVTGVSYSKTTSASVTVNSSATFSGSISGIVTGVDLLTSSYRISVPKDIWVTGVSYSKTTGATATGTSLSISTASIYGANSALKVMTGPESLDKKTANAITSLTTTSASAVVASMDINNELLKLDYVNAINSITPTSVSVLSSTTGITAGTSSTLISKTFVTDVSVSGEPTISLSWAKTAATLTKVASSYMDIVTSSTGTVLGYDISVTTSDIIVSVSGSAVTDPSVSLSWTDTAATLTKTSATTLDLTTNTNGIALVTGIPSQATVDISADVTASGTYTPSGTVTVTLSTSTANAVSSVSSGYGEVNAYAGGSHTHGVSDGIELSVGTTTLSVSPGTPPTP